MYRPMKPLLSATPKPREFLQGSPLVTFFPNMFKLPTLLSFGSLIQLMLCAIFPLRYAAIPVLALLLISIVTTIQQVLRPSTSPFTKGVVPGRTTSQIPSEHGTYGPAPAQGSLVVFQLGIQANSPLGMFAPNIRKVGQWFEEMRVDLMSRKDELGLITVSTWRGTERDSNSTLLSTFYFKNVESIHKFAHEELHKKAWTEFNKLKATDIGIFHETFVVKEGAYESLYGNCHPILLGRGQLKVEANKEGETGGEYVSTLVSADTPGLKSFSKRMGDREERESSPYGSV